MAVSEFESKRAERAMQRMVTKIPSLPPDIQEAIHAVTEAVLVAPQEEGLQLLAAWQQDPGDVDTIKARATDLLAQYGGPDAVRALEAHDLDQPDE